MNVLPMLVNELVSQASGWLNLRADENVYPMFVTWLVSQASGWLNLLAPENVYSTFVTWLVSQQSFPLKPWFLADPSSTEAGDL